MLLRPDDIIHKPDGPITATVEQFTFTGSATLYRLNLPSGPVVASVFYSHADFNIVDTVHLEVKADHLILFPPAGAKTDKATGSCKSELPRCQKRVRGLSGYNNHSLSLNEWFSIDTCSLSEGISNTCLFRLRVF